MLRQVWLYLLMLGLGLLVGGWLVHSYTPDAVTTPASPVAPQADTAQAELTRLQTALAQSEQARVRLQEQVTQLEVELAARADNKDSGATADTATKIQPLRTYRTNTETLIAVGIPESVAADIRARLDSWALEALNLRDRAKREGWLDSDQYREQAQALEDAYRGLRPEIGDDAYDRLLYALGEDNRVRVRDVMQYSAAEQAGLLPGDRIIEYADQRVFATPELDALSDAGRAGSQVRVRVERDGELLDLYLPRGPLGIRPIPVLVAP